MKYKLLIANLFLVILACNKEDTNPQSETSYAYFPLEVGNYWIYQVFQYDTAGIEHYYSIYDSMIVSGTENIEGKTYYLIEEYSNSKSFNMRFVPGDSCKQSAGYSYRDSSSYLINKRGNILLSPTNFKDTLYTKTEYFEDRILYTSFYKMEEIIEPITVEAGTFEVISYKGTHTAPNFESPNNPSFSNDYYAKNVGQVKQKIPYLNMNKGIGRSLIRYQLTDN